VKNKSLLKLIIILLICSFLAGILSVCGVNFYVKHIGGSKIITSGKAADLKDVDCIVILGCQVKENGKPSSMLSDRLNRGIELYKQGVAPKIIMSGDHGSASYDEVNAMKQFAIDRGVPSSDIFMDHAGFSTYETVYRAKEIFEADKLVIVTQEYHLHRALYIAKKMNIEAFGVSSDYRNYSGQIYREIREILARCKDFVKVMFMPEPTFLGDAITISSNGDATND